jgi:hypothetical protein
MHRFLKLPFIFFLVLLTITLAWLSPSFIPVLAQQPTGSIPTVTGTPQGPMVTAFLDETKVRAGPSSYDYPIIGILVQGESAPAIGRSPQGEWIQIIYYGVPGGTGWVYAPVVTLSTGFLPIIEPPPTSTPQTTPTLNPTYLAAFQVLTTPTRLPTFTQAPPITTVSFDINQTSRSKVPMGFVILGLAFLGVFGAIISFIRGR